jgi:quinol-cytochrome oxidoreductase complex cytochrome b subunit
MAEQSAVAGSRAALGRRYRRRTHWWIWLAILLMIVLIALTVWGVIALA